MPAARRLYLYAVAFVSLETILWGSISLLRSILSGDTIGGETVLLAQALSLIVVGLPVFGVHWWLAQRGAAQEAEERFARSRAVFLYGVLFATLIPVVQNVLALVNRGLLLVFQQPETAAILGGDQTWTDNLIAIAVNAVAAAYFFWVLRRNWVAAAGTDELGEYSIGPEDEFYETRRLYRYAWLIYSLGLVLIGAGMVLRFIFTAPQVESGSLLDEFANGLALFLVGGPLWWGVTLWDLRATTDPAERNSALRLLVLYGLIFFAVVGVLIFANDLLRELIAVLLGARLDWTAWLAGLAEPLGVALPLMAVWAYYGRQLNLELMPLTPTTAPDQPTIPRQSRPFNRLNLLRLYSYLLAALGLLNFFLGANDLLGFSLNLLTGPDLLGTGFLRSRLAAGLALVAIGLPLWLIHWRTVQAEAAPPGEAGDAARRSVIRKGYLYVVLFFTVVSGMIFAGQVIFELVRTALGDRPDNLALIVLEKLASLALLGLILAYHARQLRRDHRLSEQALARRHALYPVLLLVPGETPPEPGENGLAPVGASPANFAAVLLSALHRQAPSMPVAVHPYSQGVPDESVSAARAVVLPAELVARPSEAFRLWLANFQGPRVVIPTPVKGWQWLSGGVSSLESYARQAAVSLRRLAEGEELPSTRENSPLLFLIYIFAGLFALQLLVIALVLLGQFIW